MMTKRHRTTSAGQICQGLMARFHGRHSDGPTPNLVALYFLFMPYLLGFLAYSIDSPLGLSGVN